MASSGDHINRHIIALYNQVTSPSGPVQMQRGWQCPQCQRIYSPTKDECHHCNAQVNPDPEPNYGPPRTWIGDPPENLRPRITSGGS